MSNVRNRISEKSRATSAWPGTGTLDLLAASVLVVGLVVLAILVAFAPIASASNIAAQGGTAAGSNVVSEGEAEPDQPTVLPGPEAAERPVLPAEGDVPGGNRSAFNRPGMWIWYLDRSHGGQYAQIIKRARQSGIGTLYIKSADGRNVWRQFTRAMIRRFQRAGLRVCGWHYVYGDYPALEARASAVAARRGADCFVIDAEAEYEGKYASADRYMRVLRRLVGPKYPIALTGFPYVDYHPAFPYSVFLGPGGAQVNQPQMYWKAIGTSVQRVFEHTYLHNRLFKRPIRPLGQTYMSPTARDLKLFRRFSLSYRGAPSWWSWQETTPVGWRALGAPTAGRLAWHTPVTSHATIKRGSRGDLVVWAQQHLKRRIAPNIPITGVFGPQTQRAVRELQRRRGLVVDGVVGTVTWNHLLRFNPVRARWWIPPRQAGTARVSAAAPRKLAPASAKLPAVAYEIPPKSALKAPQARP